MPYPTYDRESHALIYEKHPRVGRGWNIAYGFKILLMCVIMVIKMAKEDMSYPNL